MSSAEDLAVDIPKIWDYLGELISPMVLDSSASCQFLPPLCRDYMAASKAGALVARIIQTVKEKLVSNLLFTKRHSVDKTR